MSVRLGTTQMKLLSFALGAACLLSQLQLAAQSEEPADWKTLNSQAIAAMRSEKFEEAEALFQKSLAECKLKDDKKIVKTNLALLMKKLGRDEEADKLLAEPVPPASWMEHTPNDAAQKSTEQAQREKELSGKIEESAKANAHLEAGHAGNASTNIANQKKVSFVEINAHIKHLDEEIKKADTSGDLETLQALFQKKADAVRIRDHGESLEYSYMLHFRAQVLHHMKRDKEATDLDTYAARVRDSNRRVRISGAPIIDPSFFDTPPAAPSITPSQLHPLNMNFEHAEEPLPTAQDYTSGSQPTNTNYARRNAINRNTPSMYSTPRKFGQF